MIEHKYKHNGIEYTITEGENDDLVFFNAWLVHNDAIYAKELYWYKKQKKGVREPREVLERDEAIPLLKQYSINTIEGFSS